MGWFKKVTKAVSKSAKYLNLASATAEGIKSLTGMSPEQQYSLGFKVASGQGASSSESGLGGLFQNILGGVVGMGQDYLQSQINLAQQKDLAKYNAVQQTLLNQQAFDNNVKMWNMQNEYNTPAAQMQRFRAAGLNPSLMYGSGTGIMNEAAPAPAAPNMAGMLKTPQMQSLMQNLDLGGSAQDQQPEHY